MRYALLAAAVIFSGIPVQAVMVSGSYQESDPTSAQVANWPTGTSPWDYVGMVLDTSTEQGSGVYLGGGWVITDAHVLPTTGTTFTLGGTSYSIWDVTQVSAGADLEMFRLGTSTAPQTPALSALSISSTPIVNADSRMWHYATMIGYGTNYTFAESWGTDLIGAFSVPLHVTGDFGDEYTTDAYEMDSTTTQGRPGDSGGGVFLYNSSSSQWQLVGITESTDGTQSTFANDPGSYYAQIEGIMAVPEPSTWGMVALGGMLALIRFHRGRRQAD